MNRQGVGLALVAAGVLLAVAAFLTMAPRPAGDANTPATSGAAAAVPELGPGAFAAGVVDATNTQRLAAGLPAVEVSECAADAGLERAANLVGTGSLEHAGLGAVHQACLAQGGSAGENLARGQATPEDMVAAWLASPGHRANLLNPQFSRVGVGCVLDIDGAMVCSQIFLGG